MKQHTTPNDEERGEHQALAEVIECGRLGIRWHTGRGEQASRDLTDAEEEMICTALRAYVESETAFKKNPMSHTEMLRECLLWLKVALPPLSDKGVDNISETTGERLTIRSLQESVRLAIREADALLSQPEALPSASVLKRGENIKASLAHDAGAYARCSWCWRYSDNEESLCAPRHPCDCGKFHGWSGSFAPPGDDAIWSEAK